MVLGGGTQSKMAANAAALLDELMGRNRNALPSDRTKELSYNDPEVKKYPSTQLLTDSRADADSLTTCFAVLLSHTFTHFLFW